MKASRIGHGLLAATLTIAGASLRAQAQQITEFQEPVGALRIASGRDGKLWFTGSTQEAPLGVIGRITINGSYREFSVPQWPCIPDSIASGPDGNLWYTRACAPPRLTNVIGAVGRITALGDVEEFAANGGPLEIASGPDGNLWFTEWPGKIGRITTTGSMTEFAIPTAGADPEGIVSGPDGNLWFTESKAARIGRITTQGAVTEFPLLSTDRMPGRMTAGPDGALWFTEYSVDRQTAWIARITLDGSVAEFQMPTPGVGLLGIAAGSDGNIWFTDLFENKIGRLTPAGSITEFPIPTVNSQPWDITAGPDGSMWFTESTGVGRVNLGPCSSPQTELCLGSPGRFKTTVAWSTQEHSGPGTANPVTPNTGAFWFFDPTNLELVVKVLDGRSVNGKFWVFYGSLTNVEFTLTVTDTETGAIRTYHNPQGQMASVADTSAF